MIGDGAHLGRVQLLVENKQIGITLESGQHDFRQFSFADDQLGIDFVTPLDNGFQHLHII